MTMKRVLVLVAAIAVLLVIVFAVLAWRPALPAIAPPSPKAFDVSLVQKGAQLVALGDCLACHTATAGVPFAGARAIQTPYGIIYSTNITPDAATGIGQWSEEAFARAMTKGVDREGRHLYPAFPYDHFNRISPDDLHAIYAYLMTRDPVSVDQPANDLQFPMNLRFLLAGWKLLFLEQGGFRPDPAQSEAWNRGAYLAEGLAHCGACHTPRNFLGAVKRRHAYQGGVAEGWRAPALTASSPSPVPWSEAALVRYLRGEVAELHDVPAGPMTPVSHSLAGVPEQDVHAIGTYFLSLMGQPADERRKRAEEIVATARRDQQAAGMHESAPAADSDLQQGERIYAGACASCHQAGRGASSGDALHVSLSTSVWLDTPANLARVITAGVIPPADEPGRWMPAFDGAFTDAQLASLIRYLRSRFASASPPWEDVDAEIRKMREASETTHRLAERAQSFPSREPS